MKPECLKCHSVRNGLEYSCSNCGSVFDLRVDFKYREKTEDNFPYIREMVSLGEQTTPILKLDSFSLKLDYYSPTFSYKDRGSRTLVSFIKENVSTDTVINEDSSGNAGASIAAYASAAGMKSRVFVPLKGVKSKLDQIRLYGAEIVQVNGTREDVKNAAIKAEGVYAGHSYIPEFRDGIRTLSYEIFSQTNGSIPDAIYMPLSAGTLFTGVLRGFEHLLTSGEIDKIPDLVAVQPERNAPICSEVDGIRREFGSSVADALVTRDPPLRSIILDGIRKYGKCISVTDNEILEARDALSHKGILTEISSATVYAAFKKKKIGNRPMLILTGNGLKTL